MRLLRIKIVVWLARMLLLPPPYFELFPVETAEFNKVPSNIFGFPVMFNREKFAQAVWPRPARRYRLFIQIEE